MRAPFDLGQGSLVATLCPPFHQATMCRLGWMLATRSAFP